MNDQMEMATKLLDAIARVTEGAYDRLDLPGPGEIKDALEDEGMVLAYATEEVS